MKIMITGGTGFIGQALAKHFLSRHDELCIVGRDEQKIKNIFGDSVKPLIWSQLNSLDAKNYFNELDYVINLVGANIGEGRWTQQRQQAILDSRLIPTQQIVDLIRQCEKPPALLSASAVGIYGLQQEVPGSLPPGLTEATAIDFNDYPCFSAEVTRRWEAITHQVNNARVVNMRFAVVLGKNGGALNKLMMPFKWGLGGVIGHGQQPFSWVALDDLIHAIDFLLQHPQIQGPVNIVSPNGVTQREFAKTLASVLHRPCVFKIPAFVLQWVFGQMADELLLNGQHVMPKKLIDNGFQFACQGLMGALKGILSG